MKFFSAIFLLLFSLMMAEAQTYDISQYQARYERRPFLELNPSFNYNGLFSNEDNFNEHTGGANLVIDWREFSNLDQRIRSFTVAGRANFFRQEYKDHDRTDRSQKGASLFAGIEQYNYFKENQFWGFRGNIFINAQDQDDLFLNSVRSTDISLRPGLFYGWGRIEFAEDALLANWMMDDLLESEVIAAASPAQRELLAKRITSIIGNRTFDFRRRRIYELQKLEQLFREENMAVDNDFLLFAVLNDNWAFANRATLPRGERLQFGVDAASIYHYQSSPIGDDFFVLEGRPYLNFTSARIKHNNASGVWGAELAGYYRENLIDSPFLFNNSYGATLSVSYEYIWLPISRTTLRWRSTMAGQLGKEERSFGLEDMAFNGQLLTLTTALTWDYFISNNWRFVLNAGVSSNWVNEDPFSYYSVVRPYINFSTRYAIF